MLYEKNKQKYLKLLYFYVCMLFVPFNYYTKRTIACNVYKYIHTYILYVYAIRWQMGILVLQKKKILKMISFLWNLFKNAFGTQIVCLYYTFVLLLKFRGYLVIIIKTLLLRCCCTIIIIFLLEILFLLLLHLLPNKLFCTDVTIIVQIYEAHY